MQYPRTFGIVGIVVLMGCSTVERTPIGEQYVSVVSSEQQTQQRGITHFIATVDQLSASKTLKLTAKVSVARADREDWQDVLKKVEFTQVTRTCKGVFCDKGKFNTDAFVLCKRRTRRSPLSAFWRGPRPASGGEKGPAFERVIHARLTCLS